MTPNLWTLPETVHFADTDWRVHADFRDVLEILRIKLVGVIPEDQSVLRASNQGEPVILDINADAGKAYADTVERLLGEERPFRFIEEEKKGFLKRLFGG